MKQSFKRIGRSLAAVVLGSALLAACGGNDGNDTLTAAQQAAADQIVADRTAAQAVGVALPVANATPTQASLDTTEPQDIGGVTIPTTDNAEPAPV